MRTVSSSSAMVLSNTDSTSGQDSQAETRFSLNYVKEIKKQDEPSIS